MNKTSIKHEHGTTKSYVIGFILSLIFTIIPYYLVVNKTVTGTSLLVAILGIAVLQMAIQLLFFLHLGRGPKPFYNVIFFFATAGVIVVTIGASLFIMNNLYKNMTPDEAILKQAQEENIAQLYGKDTGACNENKNSHVITIRNGEVRPVSVDAKRCDTLTFINEDDLTRELAFGTHPYDVSYGGNYTVVLDDNRPETITLNEIGEFDIHDHFDPELTGRFSVEQQL